MPQMLVIIKVVAFSQSQTNMVLCLITAVIKILIVKAHAIIDITESGLKIKKFTNGIVNFFFLFNNLKCQDYYYFIIIIIRA